jgi:hypothetical protein
VIFGAQLARKALTGAKTQTRRPIRDGRLCRYRVHHTYAVQPGRGKPEAGRILVTAVRQQRLGDITLREAHAEGFRTTGDFKAAWVEIHDARWISAHIDEGHEARWTSAHVEGLDTVLDGHPRMVLERFDARHADTPVWVIEFTLPVDPVRLLADRNARADYVDHHARAMADEPEAVDEDTQRRITRDAGLRDTQLRAVSAAQREAELGLLTLGERLDRVVASMRADRQSSTTDVRVLAKRVDALERKHYRDAA